MRIIFGRPGGLSAASSSQKNSEEAFRGNPWRINLPNRISLSFNETILSPFQ